MDQTPKRLSLDGQVNYEICISGKIDKDWTDWLSEVAIKTTHPPGKPMSTIMGTFDQATLHGILRGIYSLGYPLISVNCYSRSDHS